MSSSPDYSKLPQEERIKLALESVAKDKLSLRKAALVYQVPRSTLTDRAHGKQPRMLAHEREQKLKKAEKDVLVEWVKELGRRGLPVSPQALRDHASDICGEDVGVNWYQRFMKRHPDLKSRTTTSLEASRARSLNPAVVKEFFDMLTDVIEKYQIPEENIYNMDEKGVQLGIGQKYTALIDRNQKSVQHIETGNRDLITILETVCADGSALDPCVIFEGKRRNLEWTRNNPCKASTGVSPKGWTDQELGSLWLKINFDPLTKERNKTNGYRLLILDGHNSHCTYQFCKYAAENKIIVVCLPAHTTHALQPCDVGVFGPLAACWKREVLRAEHENSPITKTTFLKHYAAARARAFKKTTIKAAFLKTGIWPLNPDAISQDALAPSLNTTTQSAQPIPASLPSLLIPIYSQSSIDSVSHSVQTSTLSAPTSTTSAMTQSTTPSVASQSSTTSAMTESSTTSDSTVSPPPPMPTQYLLAGLPPPAPFHASRDTLRRENEDLRKILEAATTQIQRDYAHKRLMDAENAKLRKRLYHKENKPRKLESTGHARILTSEESLDALSRAYWERSWKELLREAAPYFKEQRKIVKEFMDAEKRKKQEEDKKKKDDERAAEKKKREEEAKLEKQRKAEEREAEKKRKELEAAAEKIRLAEEKAAEKVRKDLEHELERQRKAEARARERILKAAERAEEKRRKAEENALKMAQQGPATKAGGKGRGGRKAVAKEPDACSQDLTESTHQDVPKARPRPRPITKKHQLEPQQEDGHSNTPICQDPPTDSGQPGVELAHLSTSLRRNPHRNARK